jgi:DNA-binding transcriptional LysR family regulator
MLIYRERNMTRASEEMRLSKAALTKRLHLLEQELGYLLFRRSTRKLTPTPEGERLYRSSLKLFESVRDFEAEVKGEETMAGQVRITSTSAMTQRFLSKILIDFHSQQPEIELDVIVTDSFLDLIENDIDLALRVGNIPASNLHGKRLAENRTVLCASPAYLKKNGSPRQATDLKKHPLAYLDVHEDLRFSKSKLALKSVTGIQKVKTNDANLVTELGLTGQAMIVRSVWDIRSHIDKGKLVPVLTHDPIEPNGDIWLLASAGRLQTKRVRALFDHISSEIIQYL